jgi:hypothetical protein
VTHKPGAAPRSVKAAYVTSYIRQRSGGRRSLGVAANLTTRKGYRADLRPVSLYFLYLSAFLPCLLFVVFFFLSDVNPLLCLLWRYGRRILVRTHWNRRKAYEGWAWICMRDNYLLEPIKLQ